MIRDSALVLLVALLSMLPGIGQTWDIRSRELRHAEIAREMALSGDYVVPTLIGRAYRDKPPVLHAAAALLFRAAGGPSLALARLPSALAAALVALATLGLGRMLADRRTALLAAISLIGVQQFGLMARTARPDMILTLSTTAACLGLAWGTASDAARARRLAAAVLAGAGAGLGLLTKGPLGLAVPLIFGVLLPWRDPRHERPRLSFVGVSLLALLATAAVWVVPAWLRDGGEYLRSVVFQPDLTSGASGHARPFWWYLGPLLATALPLTFFFPAIWVRARRRGPGPALATAIGILILLSAIPGKRNHYLLPLYPFLALATAVAVTELGRARPWLVRTAWSLAIVAAAAPVLYALVWLPLARDGESPELAYARQVRTVTGPDAALVSDEDLSQPLAWALRRSDFAVFDDREDLDASLARTPPPAWLVIGREMPELVAHLAARYRVREVEVPGEDRKGRGLLYRIEGRR